MNITQYLKLMVEKKASDLFFTANAQVKIKIEGRQVPVGKTFLTGEMVKDAAYGIMNEKQIRSFEVKHECDFAIVEEDVGRFRVNVFLQRGQVAMVLRYIPSEVPKLADLGLPDVLKDLIMHKRGMILLVGATGSGKSTTIAAMIRHRNESEAVHILTVEDPIEYNHANIQAIINQREIGQDTLSYANALKQSLREAPDIVVIGECRDQETMEAAIQLAGTGQLAISTLHANNAHQTMDRIINMFPQQLHKQLFMDLSINLRAIISQRLVMSREGKRIAAVEVMLNTPHIADLILKGKIDEIREAMEESHEAGMQSFDEALHRLFKAGRVTLEEALRNADSRANLEAKINFG
ncbi:MAG: PilT/PilU family type 4a pilus ATPase [Gammaproteobacteria bacterium]|nr:PilT/PilU family type 4a pilus ATPase [Gammaproteobacteria bacterium]